MFRTDHIELDAVNPDTSECTCIVVNDDTDLIDMTQSKRAYVNLNRYPDIRDVNRQREQVLRK
jgi:hypothetical protein